MNAVPQHFFYLSELFGLVERLHLGESYMLLPGMEIRSPTAASTLG